MAPHKRKAKGEPDGVKKKQALATSAASRRITRTMTTDGPRQAVFATAELIENILMHAPVRSIFAIQRVARQFRDIVVTSVDLQQRMFLRPPNPILAETWVLVEKHEDGSDDEVEDDGEEYWVVRVPDSIGLSAFTAFNRVDSLFMCLPASALNPCLKKGDYPLPSQPTLIERVESQGETLVMNISERALREPGSWRNMYLADQLCKRDLVSGSWKIKSKGQPLIHGDIWADVETQGPHGFTLGTLMDAAFQQALPDEIYTEGQQIVSCSEPVDTLLGRLEVKYGTKAVLANVTIYTTEIVLPNEQELASALEIQDSMMQR
ncbi:hypothetical protein LTR17_004512 [Elasticomyces elasticus]|nr:hypothetical protein LTR17_004512 [Elasticomyces elasticus]